MLSAWSLLLASGTVASQQLHLPCAAALAGVEEICHPAGLQFAALDLQSPCVPLRLMLAFRSRLVRVLQREDLPSVAPRSEWQALKVVARAESAAVEGRGLSGSCPKETTNLQLAIAVVCAGLLESEALAVPNAVRSEISSLANATALLLPGLLRCPWALLAATGWPIFALLARTAHRLAAALGSSRRSGSRDCSSRQSYLQHVVSSAAAAGLEVPAMATDELAVPLLAGGDEPWKGAAAAASAAACLWEAADSLALPAKVCVLGEGGETGEPLLAARDCNAAWPGCPPATEHKLQFWMELPRRRDMAADSIREEQVPFCVNNQAGVLAWATRWAVSTLRSEHAERPLSVVEVGAHYGDCSLLVLMVARSEAWPVNVTLFEANPDTALILKANLLQNDLQAPEASIKVAAVSDSMGGRVRLVAHQSSAHASLSGFGHALDIGQAQSIHFDVETTTLDAELTGGRLIDLLLIAVNGAELAVLRGAHLLLSRQKEAPRIVLCLTWHWDAYRDILYRYGYHFVREVRSKGTVFSMAARDTL
eukprot:TRINITY_DN25546_c0_g1_i2.p1 TRINITY_DN25546_c0_g1~~TRINITY_DN25546_c0_g1_i2.p1  ORF type:complete len:538 (-),score=119.99 TRINITY_DN25546_c0_g1_i2:98-1711(-)